MVTKKTHEVLFISNKQQQQQKLPKRSGPSVMGISMMHQLQCGRQTIEVLEPNGQIRQWALPVKVSDLLAAFPHHYVAHNAAPAPIVVSSKRSMMMLPFDASLDPGSAYAIHPMPRLFPPPHDDEESNSRSSSSSSSSSPSCSAGGIVQSCACFWQLNQQNCKSGLVEGTGIGNGVGVGIKLELKRRLAAAFQMKILASSAGGIGEGGGCRGRGGWEPALDVIMEEKVLMRTRQEEAEIQSSSSSSSRRSNSFAKKGSINRL